MGGATHICSDKTGTLTQNKMTVMAVQFGNTVNIAMTPEEGNGLSNKVSNHMKQTTIDEIGKDAWESMVQSVLFNSSARVEKNDKLEENLVEWNK